MVLQIFVNFAVFVAAFNPGHYSCSSPSLLRSCLDELRKLLLQNGYPAGVVNYNINDVLNRQQNKPKNPTTTVPIKETILVLPY